MDSSNFQELMTLVGLKSSSVVVTPILDVVASVGAYGEFPCRLIATKF